MIELKKGGDHEWLMLDGSIVTVHQDAMRSCLTKSAEAIGRCVGGFTSKIHAKVDAFGQLLKVVLTPGQVHEAKSLLKYLLEKIVIIF